MSSLPVSFSLVLPLLLFTAAIPALCRWRYAQCINGAALALAVIGVVAPPLAPAPLQQTLNAAIWDQSSYAIQAIAVLVTFLAFILAHYSEHYLAGEARQSQYIGNFQLTIGSVLLVVLANHLGAIIVGWIAISLGLHRLLLFYPTRTRAVLAAHKKFLLARVAELALVFAGLLLYVEYGTWQMTDLMAAVANGESSLRAQIAAVLLAQAALIKCAQLPLHGWLIQVVEAPTPVSALLHAGVINLGGVLLIMFAPLISQVPVAQWWILIVAGVSTAIAVSVMSVETNVKAQLAWSTSAQMGLMLIECALGLYHLALLHLLAHSCYKAWSFLAAGTRVARPAQRPVSALWVAPVAAAIATTTMVFLPDALGTTMPLSSRTLLAVLLFAVLLEALVSKRAPRLIMAALAGLGMVVMYTGLEHTAAQLIDTNVLSASSAADLWVSGLLVSMAVLWWVVRQFGHYPVGAWLQHKLYRGLYLDEWFTRATLRLCPVRLPNTLALTTTKHTTTQECL